jgi:nucleotide-binding universal stress UspA family protein
MKTILVPLGGGDADAAVLDTARTVAQPLCAHLELLHVRVTPAEAAAHTPHVDFARGVGLASAMDALGNACGQRAASAERNARDFCARHAIEMAEIPRPAQAVTARWRLDEGEPIARLLFHARHHDLVVMARPTQLDGLPSDRLETLLLGCGRPLLIAPTAAPMPALGTMMVCWKETRDAARAVSAAMPLLAQAQRVVVVSVNEDGGQTLAEGLRDIVRELAWNGISAEAQLLARGASSTSDTLFAAARDHKADLVVMGAYGHRYLREALFGGCTQSAIDLAEFPIFLVH